MILFIFPCFIKVNHFICHYCPIATFWLIKSRPSLSFTRPLSHPHPSFITSFVFDLIHFILNILHFWTISRRFMWSTITQAIDWLYKLIPGLLSRIFWGLPSLLLFLGFEILSRFFFIIFLPQCLEIMVDPFCFLFSWKEVA